MKSKYKSTIDKLSKYLRILILLLIIQGCETFVDVGPPKNELVSVSVFENDQTANSVIAGIYSRMVSSLGFAGGYYNSITVTSGLAADELFSFRPPNSFFENALTPDDQAIRLDLWNEPYEYIYTVNMLLESLLDSNISMETKKQLEGEARFIRAFSYFYLTNLFGDVPMHLESDYRENSKRTRISTEEIYNQIIEDLQRAANLMESDYSWSDGERVRPNKWVALALLSRVYLYTQQWQEAMDTSNMVINNTALFEMEDDLNDVFLKGSNEAIWQLKQVRPGLNTLEGLWFIPAGTRASSVGLTESLLNSFQENDQRKTAWIASATNDQISWQYPYKYKVRRGEVLEEYSIVIRLAEIYLIRAEANAHLNNISDAYEDINKIRNRAGLDNLTGSTVDVLLEHIAHERQIELFCEWGHRWLDLKRTGKADEILSEKTGWDNTDVLYPIPSDEIIRNSLITQNPGY